MGLPEPSPAPNEPRDDTAAVASYRAAAARLIDEAIAAALADDARRAAQLLRSSAALATLADEIESPPSTEGG